MASKDIIKMTQRELQKLNIVHKIIDKRISIKDGSIKLSLSYRQMKRLVSRVRKQGDPGIVHASRGKVSNNKLPEELRLKVIQLYQKEYFDFNLVHACEKLLENHKIKISDQTLSNWLDDESIPRKRKKGRKHRSWRERMLCQGELLQMDGSHHDWFEGRADKCCLMAYIDDATNEVYMRFYEYEGTFPAMDSFRRFVRKKGLPMAVYSDKHTTYKSPKEPTIEEQLEGTEPQSQFQRALSELGVKMIFANSAQAKGRIERQFETLQDRLVKELRLRNISTIEDANAFLDKEYISTYNKKFMRKPVEEESMYQKIIPGINLDRILCIKSTRHVNNDLTISYNSNLYQIQTKTRAKKVVVEVNTKENVRISYKGKILKYKKIIKRKPVVSNKELTKKRSKIVIKPDKDHPWKKALTFKRLEAMQNILNKQKPMAKEKELLTL